MECWDGCTYCQWQGPWHDPNMYGWSEVGDKSIECESLWEQEVRN